ncbi:hypothetical protein HMPREF0004_1656 [Achromobacter piechaudii ATCC 43553]|uniref:Uncharacterized protein n=1 Tax=Achromobacter piechaudii ATCC 43553 TaxID=742159 RepID=D4X859_9BURK|nr:hypothetical protein HMPREF0004_1656 [Achromobacter piechaudii ATCC 43553]
MADFAPRQVPPAKNFQARIVSSDEVTIPACSRTGVVPFGPRNP